MYCCFSSRGLPEGFDPAPPIPEGETRFQDLTQEIERVSREYERLPIKYRSFPAGRAVVIALLVIGLTVGILALQGRLFSFPGQVLTWFQNLNWTHVFYGFCGFALLSTGALLLIALIIKQNYIHGKFSGDGHWQATYYISEGENYYFPGYIDTSTLAEDGSGTALYYGKKDILEHYVISSTIVALSPLHAAAAMAYHVVRIVVIPFYILGCMVIEACTGRSLYPEQRAFTWGDIPKQMWFSVKQFVIAPFFALAQMYAALYSYLDPLGGRKLGSLIEKEWNNGIERYNGFWSVQGPQSPEWRLEGGGGPDRLGQTGFYAAGCWTPMAKIVYGPGGTVLSQTSASGQHQYTFTTAATLRARHNQAVSQIRV